MIEKVKLHEVARDLNLNGKDLMTLLQERFGGEARKSQTVLSGEELNFVMEHYTKQHAVKDFGEYFKMGEAKNKPEEKPAEKAAPAPAPAPKPAEKPAAPAPRPQQPAAGSNNGYNNNQNRPQQGNNRPQGERRFENNNNRPQGERRFDNNRPGDRRFENNGNRPQGDRRFENNRENNRPQQGNGLRPNLNQKPAAPAPKPAEKPAAPQQPAAPRKPIEIRQQAPKQKGPKGENTFTANTVTRTTVDMRTSEVNLDKYNERYEQIAPASNMKDNFAKKQKLNQKSARRGKPVLSRKEREEEKMRRLELERQRRQRLEVALPEEMTVGELALTLKVQASEIVKKLMGLGVMASISDVIDFDTASLVAMEIGAKVTKQVVVTIEDRLFEVEDKEEAQEPRPPIVVVMGHVDHGKTSILDAIRKTSVVSGEAGGITQHIGAYQVQVDGRPITFLDTPGHAAFTSMRARGAQVTDIAVLVVAADDGIMPQTVEAINHAKEAGVSIIVAINKMDKPEANPERIKQQLTEYELVPEEWGGDTICVPVSAKTGAGLDNLLEMILLVADTMELTANPNRMAKGTVIEAKLDTGRGPVATVLIQTGTLHSGEAIIAGTAVGRVRVMTNDKGQKVEEAGPSCPVEITGLAEVPAAGDIFNAVEDEKLARELVEKRRMEQKEEEFKRYQKVTLDNLFEHISEGEVLELPIIVKGDVQGSVEAVRQSLEKLSNNEVRVRVIHGAVGAVSESDVMLANASHAIIVGFNVRPDPTAKANAERDGVEIRLYRIIYDAIEEIEAAMKGMLKPKTEEVDLGRAEIRNVYKISGVGAVAGCYVLDGKMVRSANVRVVRDGIIIADDKMASLRRFKDDVKEVAQGYECGITLEKFSDLKNGDIFEAYEIREVKQ
ncbi:MAG TPA: translation initiation factor IF-2 [Ruminococcaceae bacterium]|nr:translation initiation factor IF-2 [Oscillospiraceae bacterium]